MKTENDQRLREANNFISHYRENRAFSLALKLTEDVPLDIAVTIITVSRNRHKFDSYEPRYLTQALLEYIKLIEHHSALYPDFNIQLSICNVDSDPVSYFEAERLGTVFNNSVRTFKRFSKKLVPPTEIFEKEKQDYVYCMNQSLSLNPRHVLLVEDDTLPNKDLFVVLQYLIDTLLDKQFQSGHDFLMKKPRPNTYLKLYHPERLQGFYSLEVDRIPGLIAFGCVCGSILTVIYSFIGFRQTSANIHVVWVIFILYFILLAIAIGNPNLLALRRICRYFYGIVPSPSCCTPAMLFPNSGAKEISNYLDSVTCRKNYAKDTALDELRSKTNLKAYAVQPNLFRHIGLYSSLRENILDPYVV